MRVTRTYLQLSAPGQFRAAFAASPDLRLEHIPHPPPALYRQCYRTVGAAYGWRDRWGWSDEEIRAHLADPGITFQVATHAGALAGYYELRRVSEDDSVEVAYFGLHTCTLDHPHALPNYVARGFVPYKTELYEVDSAT